MNDSFGGNQTFDSLISGQIPNQQMDQDCDRQIQGISSKKKRKFRQKVLKIVLKTVLKEF